MKECEPQSSCCLYVRPLPCAGGIQIFKSMVLPYYGTIFKLMLLHWLGVFKYCQAQGQGQSQSQTSNVKTRP